MKEMQLILLYCLTLRKTKQTRRNVTVIKKKKKKLLEETEDKTLTS